MGSWGICSLRVFYFSLCCFCFFLFIEVIGFSLSYSSHFFTFSLVLKYKTSLKMTMHTKLHDIQLQNLKTYNKQKVTPRN